MYDRHLSQRVGHDHGDQSAEQIGNDHTRTRECDGYAAAKEEADSNGATDGNHRELARAQAALELIGIGRRGCFREWLFQGCH